MWRSLKTHPSAEEENDVAGKGRDKNKKRNWMLLERKNQRRVN